MGVVLLFEDVVESFDGVDGLVVDLLDFHWLEHFLRGALDDGLLQLGVVDYFRVGLFAHFLLQSHSLGELVYF